MQFLLFMFAIVELLGGPIEAHFRQFDSGMQLQQIEHIDCIYLINLDQRPEKLEPMAKQFSDWELSFVRFPAIYGWGLPVDTFNDLGVKFLRGMKIREEGEGINYNEMILVNPLTTANPDQGEYLIPGPQLYGRNCFSISMKAGAVGCTLSHLSVLQNGYDAGYETIWILEDDCKICHDPRALGNWIHRLDQVGEWDVLYTDNVTRFVSHDHLEWIWRPDFQIDYSKLLRMVDLGAFYEIGGRGQTHSMIVSRRGMEKILQFYKTRGMFLPYDMELSIIPGIKLYNMKNNWVIQEHTISDTVRKNF